MDRTRVRRRGHAVRAVELESCVESAVSAVLRGGEGESHAVWIKIVDLVVIPAIAGVAERAAAAGGDGFERVRAENPVAEVDDVDVLLDEDVSGERGEPEPVAQAVFVGR